MSWPLARPAMDSMHTEWTQTWMFTMACFTAMHPTHPHTCHVTCAPYDPPSRASFHTPSCACLCAGSPDSCSSTSAFPSALAPHKLTLTLLLNTTKSQNVALRKRSTSPLLTGAAIETCMHAWCMVALKFMYREAFPTSHSILLLVACV